MKLVIEMELDNAAFTDNPTDEIRYVIQDAISRMPDQLETGKLELFDSNGNTVGTARIVD